MKIKVFTLKVIKYIPSNSLKVGLLRMLFGYKIGKNVKIGRSFINSKEVIIEDNVQIGNKNTMSCKRLVIGMGTKILYGNHCIGNGVFQIGKNSRVISSHYFDLYNDICIGNDTWIAGNASQFWTHGSIHTKKGTKDLSISIGDNVYIGSSSCVGPGTKICSVNLIGLGSVVSGVFDKEKTIILGNPAKVVKQDIDWRENW